MASERRIVFGGGHAPIGWSVGFLRAPFETVAEATLAWWRKLQHDFERVEIGAVFPDGVLALSPLQTPPTREILARTSGNEWTANLVNNHLGGDSVSWCGHLSEVIGCEAVLATHVPADQYAYPTRPFGEHEQGRVFYPAVLLAPGSGILVDRPRDDPPNGPGARCSGTAPAWATALVLSTAAMNDHKNAPDSSGV